MWRSCQYGSGKAEFAAVAAASAVLLLLRLILRLRLQKAKMTDRVLTAATGIGAAATLLFAAGVIYAAIPYHGALSWKADEWLHQKNVKLEQNNIFLYGVDGILQAAEDKLQLPDTLYVSDNGVDITFDENGDIITFEAYLYGKNANNKTQSYLITYRASESRDMTIFTGGEVREDYSENCSLEPLQKLLREAPYQKEVENWRNQKEGRIYGIVYYGRRSFESPEGLTGLDSESRQNIEKMSLGGQITGFEMSVYIPSETEVTPIRYICDSAYRGQEILENQDEREAAEEAKAAEGWTVNQSDETMLYFLNDRQGWKLKPVDAAAGSRWYELQKTEDGGKTWEVCNKDPFLSDGGTAEGLEFFDENFGIAGLSGASQTHSNLYVTYNGGLTFSKLEFPDLTEEQLPASAAEYGLKAEDYAYYSMPVKEGDLLKLQRLSSAQETEGITYISSDQAATWQICP